MSAVKSKKSDWAAFAWLIAFVFAVIAGWGIVVAVFGIKGTVGDAFGVVNSLFSGLAFAGIIYAIVLQRRELSLQRRELRMTRKELKRAAAAQERSEKALREGTESSTRPYLKLMLQPTAWQMQQLVIANVGRTAAEDVLLAVEPEVYRAGTDREKGLLPLSSLPLFQRSGLTVAPDVSLVYGLLTEDAVKEIAGDKATQPARFCIRATYSSRTGQRFTESTELSPLLIEGTWPYKDRNHIEAIERGIDGLRRAVEQSSQSVKSGLDKLESSIRARR